MSVVLLAEAMKDITCTQRGERGCRGLRKHRCLSFLQLHFLHQCFVVKMFRPRENLKEQHKEYLFILCHHVVLLSYLLYFSTCTPVFWLKIWNKWHLPYAYIQAPGTLVGLLPATESFTHSRQTPAPTQSCYPMCTQSVLRLPTPWTFSPNAPFLPASYELFSFYNMGILVVLLKL